ncbi:hypothetical protein [Acidovorax sp. NCPPB 3576]|uniref:hypothetical protein n=1 Tax=Acidovorax sp. NCPPB 3576 TaxID=2940488 RepID=UPI00234AA4CA|nr:hypothetical protein [Acidovorax sp. NCPPB 3576]WCM90505.1 hypothetical protein M5C98_11030 [Acidovorax sp. NCPPB 3576]
MLTTADHMHYISLDEFRVLVAQTPPLVPHSGAPSELYEYAGIDPDGSFQLSRVREVLNRKVQDSFANVGGTARAHCHALRTDLIREHVILERALEPYLEILNLIHGATNFEHVDGEEPRASWGDAVQAAQDLLKLNPPSGLDASQFQPREFVVACAARALKARGFEIELGPGILNLTDIGEGAAVARLEELIARLGGLNLLRSMFAFLEKSAYSTKQERYHLIPRVALLSDTAGKRQVPWGYLFNLAVKHLHGKRPLANTAATWAEIIELSADIAAVMDVHQYSNIVFHNVSAERQLSIMREAALYDTMFRLPQLRPSDALKLCHGLLRFRALDLPMPAGWTLQQAFDVVGAILDTHPETRGPIIFSLKSVQGQLAHIPPKLVSTILESVMSHSSLAVNSKYSRPTDIPGPAERADEGITFGQRPLLRMPGARFVLADRSVCAPAFLEALLAQLRLVDRGSDDKVGLQAEAFLREELRIRNVPVHGGDYDFAQEHGECDAVVETDERIVFIEQKKKPLTRVARAGSDVHLLIDLAGSMMAAQAQAGWHEVRIRSAGHLDLEGETGTYRLERRGRDIERVALALLDYGSFQSRDYLLQMLQSSLWVSYSVQDPALNTRLNGLNKALAEIRQQVTHLALQEDRRKQPFFHCWFLSLPQLLILLDDVHDTTSFWKALQMTRHTSTGSADFYFDFERIQQIRGG